MNAKQMEQFEREKAEAARRNKQRIQAQTGVQQNFPDEVKRAGDVMGMTPEKRKAWFDHMREMATGDASRETDREREQKEKDEAQK